MAYAQSVHTKRTSEKVRLLGWINIAVSSGLVYLAPSMVPALIAACFWIIAVLGITQALAWHMDRKQNPLERLKGN